MGIRSWLGVAAKPAAAMPASRTAARFDALGWDQFPWWATQQTDGFCARVSRAQALAVPAVLRGRNLIAGTPATLPLIEVDAQLRRMRSPLLEQIDPDVPNSVTMAMTFEDLLFEGISWWRVLARSNQWPVAARHVDFDAVSVQPPADYPISKLPSGYCPGSHIFMQGVAVPVADVIRFDSPNPPLLVAAAKPIRRASQLETAADLYASNPQMRGYFRPRDGGDPTDAEVTAMLDDWETSRRTRTTGYVPDAFEYAESKQLSPVDLQLAQLQREATLGLANAMGLDPEDLGVSTTSRTYQNAVDRRQDRVNETYGPYLQAVEDRLSMGDVTRRGHQVTFELDDFLKANPTDRSEIDKTYVDIGAKTPGEVRATSLRLPPLTAEQRAAGGDQSPPADIAAGGQRLATVHQLPRTHATPVATRFAADTEASGFVFDVSDLPVQTFAVSEAKRTITGLVVPWNRVGRSGGRKWMFAPGALKFNAGHVNRIKLLADHDNSAIIGRVDKTWTDDVGQWAVFKVARGEAGDRALAMAADGVKDGLSVGIGYAGEDNGVEWRPHPDDGTVSLITSAPWRETSQVAMPAFDDARVSAVSMAASKPLEGDIMKCSICGQEHAPGIACPQAPAPTLTPEQLKAVGEAAAAAFAAHSAAQAQQPDPVVAVKDQIDQAFKGLDEKITAQVEAAFAKFAADNGPAKVNPLHDLKVDEAPLYRFDGKPAQRCFTADIASDAFAKDPELRRKAEALIAAEMAAQFANVTTTNVAALNPAIQRPDLYVPSLHFTRSLGMMTMGGVVDSITKQTLPKFNAASGLAATNTEGTEPTDGAFSTTSQDVTPKAISGRVTINREVVDQGGTPQTDQLIWNEMTQFYAELLETRLVDALQALALTDIDIVGVDAALQAALLNEIAGLQFVKGGDRYRGFGLNQDLYAAVIGAVDNDGRPLFPMLNPVNSSGSSALDFSAVRVGSKVGVPAWALATANGGPAKSFLFVPESVYQWFSPPKRIDLDRIAVATVGIGIWGYSAEFVTRSGDVKQLAYAES